MSRSPLHIAHPASKTRYPQRPVHRQAPAPAPPPGIQLSLNQQWLFHRAEGEEQIDAISPPANRAGETVNLPHSVRLESLNASGGRNFQGICWYYKKLLVPSQWDNRVILLQFQGAMQVAQVWVNGRKAAEHHCGYTPFTIDLTRLVCHGQPNDLAVRLDNRDDPQVPPGKPQRELDFTYFGGLYRNVRLLVLDRLHITDPILEDHVGGGGIFVTYPKITTQEATVRVRTEVRNEYLQIKRCTVEQELIDPQGVTVASISSTQSLDCDAYGTFIQTLQVAAPALWHPDHPHLYRLRTTVLDEGRPADQQTTRIGIRHIRFDKDKGLLINHERFFSIGANRHQDHPYVGNAMPDSGHRRDVKKLRQGGFTSIRSHYPQASAFMDACDELGMLAIVSNPGWQFVGDKIFQQRAVANARRMVRRDRNRPSVVLWEAALNESDNRTLGPALGQAVHEEYPGDQCYTAGDREKDPAATSCWDVDFLHNDGAKPHWIREWGDHVDNWRDQQSRSRVRRAWGETPMLVQARSHLERLDEIMAAGKPAAGACLWAGIDCQRGYHQQPFHGGVLDLHRLPKFDYYFFQSQRCPYVHVPGLDDGPMVFIAGFATFFSPTDLTVFSNCQQVRLWVGERELGLGKPEAGHAAPHPPFTFRVPAFVQEQSTMYMNSGAKIEGSPLELRAEGIIDGQVVASHVVRPPGVAARIDLQVDLCGSELIADGSDWVRVYATVCDARGTACPFADDLIHFTAAGEGQIVGGTDIGANPLPAEAGIATAIVRAASRAGRIVVSADAFGLARGQVQITSLAPESLC